MKLHIGTSGFGYAAWKGKFYTRDLADDAMLSHYASHFHSVEINASFYRMPRKADVRKWAAEVPADFVFAFKAPRQITHSRRLMDCSQAVEKFCVVTGSIGKQCGPLLFQLPPNFKKDAERLRDFLKLLPRSVRIAFEFRHPSWFEPEIFALLRKRDAALCIAEDDNDLQVPFEATALWGYLRLRRLDYTAATLKTHAKQIAKQEWTDSFVFFKHEDKALGVGFAKQFQEIAEEKKKPRAPVAAPRRSSTRGRPKRGD